MTIRLLAAACSLVGSVWAANLMAQTVDQLVTDPAALKAEMDRCETLGFASENDARCKIANAAEQKRFMGSGVTYTPLTVDVFPNHEKVEPQPKNQVPKQSGRPDE